VKINKIFEELPRIYKRVNLYTKKSNIYSNYEKAGEARIYTLNLICIN
jgi:hypothetical protein